MNRHSYFPSGVFWESSRITVYELLRAFDAHFHLDRYSIRRHGDIDLSIGELVEEKLQTPTETHLQLVGGVLVHCDVDSYPTTFPEDTRWKVAVAIHPRTSPVIVRLELVHYRPYYAGIALLRIIKLAMPGAFCQRIRLFP
jgi:hypothetical protein